MNQKKPKNSTSSILLVLEAIPCSSEKYFDKLKSNLQNSKVENDAIMT